MERLMVSVLLCRLLGAAADPPLRCQPDIYTELSRLSAQVEGLRIECGDAPTVAFSASLLETGRGHSGPYNTDTVLVFKNIITNSGNAYSQITGVFTAPVGGVYYFAFSSHSLGSHTSALSLFRNEDRVASVYDHAVLGAGDSAGNAAVLQLQQGDRVSLRLWGQTLAYDDRTFSLTTFSGFLIKHT